MTTEILTKARLADLVQYVATTGTTVNETVAAGIKQYKKDIKSFKSTMDLVHTSTARLSTEEESVLNVFNTKLNDSYLSLYDTIKNTYGVHSLEYKQFLSDVLQTNLFAERDRNYNYSIKLKETKTTSRLIKAFTTLPVADISTIVSLAAKLNLVIIPIQYFIGYTTRYNGLVDDTVYNSTQKERDRYVAAGLSTHDEYVGYYNKIIGSCGDHASAWVVCPVQMLDVEYLVSDPSYRFYAPPQLVPALTTMRMMAPMLNQMRSQIKNMETTQTQHSEMLRNHERRLGSHDEMIRTIRNTIAENEKREQEMKAEYQNMLVRQQEEMNALRSVSLFDLTDPMLVLVPSNITDINTYTGTCNIVGCWGPEFDATALKDAGINTVFTGQATAANELVLNID